VPQTETVASFETRKICPTNNINWKRSVLQTHWFSSGRRIPLRGRSGSGRN